MTEKNAKVTILDIARDTGVSPASVSLALRNKPGVGASTRERILRSAQSLGYPLQALPEAASTVSSIGLVMKVRPGDQPLSNQFYAPVLGGIESDCRKHGINLFYAHLPVDEANNPLQPPRLLREQHADGLLFVGATLNEPTKEILKHLGVPVVLVDAYAESGQYDSVVTDNYGGAYAATQHLISRGHRHIAIVGSLPEAYPSILERRNGYLAALAAHGLEPVFADCHHHPDEAMPATMAMLQAYPEVSAVFGVNDEVAIGVMNAATTLGREVAADLSVIGFDNISLARHVSPPLTTMRVDKVGMGRLATQLLTNRIAYPDSGYVRAVIHPSLITRESVRSVSSAAP